MNRDDAPVFVGRANCKGLHRITEGVSEPRFTMRCSWTGLSFCGKLWGQEEVCVGSPPAMTAFPSQPIRSCWA